MSVIEQLKLYANAIGVVVILVCVGYVAWLHYDRNSIKAEFAAYQGEINDQVKKNKAEAAAEKERQDAKFKGAQTAYESDRLRLAVIIKRLRDAQGVPGSEPVPVADGSGATVPAETGGTAGVTVTLKTYSGTASLDFYADAMTDNLQCAKLIEFVK